VERIRLGWAVPILLLAATAVEATPVRVRLTEGNTRGFLVVRSAGGEPIGRGELRQRPDGGTIESRLALTFRDGSVHDEVTTFSQRGVFRLEAYRLVQRGPSFPGAEIAFDRKSGRYQARARDRDGAEQTASGALEMPPDLYNGMALVLLKNLPAGERATVQMAAFTPGARLIRMVLGAEGEERVRFAGAPVAVTRYLVNLEIGGLTGLLASMVGMNPPDLRYWLVPGEVPAFVRFEGAMFLNGPVWRVEMVAAEWP
jgi:hypothetical protein